MDKIIHKIINEFTDGVDTYTHNGSTWLIFTEFKQWVIELTEDKTLWYNYNFFKEVFSYASMDVVDNQQYITKWVEDNIINGVKRTMSETIPDSFLIEDTIQNGVKRTKDNPFSMITNVENTIQNGVKETIELMNELPNRVKKIIKKGVKETNHVDVMKFFDNKMDDAIENGVKEIFDTEYMPNVMVEDTIQNGIKETKTPGKDGEIMSTVEWLYENKSNSYTKMINDVLDNGEKINGTYAGGQRQSEKCKSVVEYGTKNPTD